MPINVDIREWEAQKALVAPEPEPEPIPIDKKPDSAHNKTKRNSLGDKKKEKGKNSKETPTWVQPPTRALHMETNNKLM